LIGCEGCCKRLIEFFKWQRLTSTQKHYLQLQYLQGMGFKSVWFGDLQRKPG
jgi:predicted Fe-S protein YdhL (DUF1289 family)